MIRQGSKYRVLQTATFLGVLALAASLLASLAVRAQQPTVPIAGAGGGAKAGPDDRAKDIDSLKDEIRKLRETQEAQQSLLRMLEIHFTFGPPTELRNEDYARARSQFQTKLLRRGPSPQRWSPVQPPAGVTEIEYRSGDLRLKAWVNRPEQTTRRYPAVLYLHGGFAFGMGDWDQCKPYRDAGFVVLAPMLRGENGQPGAFSYFYDELDDVLAAADYLSKQPYVDASRLFVAGHSVGGNLTLLAAMASQRFRAAAAVSSAPDQAVVIKRGSDYPFDKTDPRELLLRSATAYAGSFKCPVSIYYGTEEINIHLMSQRTAALARERGLDVQASQIEGNHGTCVPEAIKQSIAFFQKNSPP
jgi:dienelactone hydrolase